MQTYVDSQLYLIPLFPLIGALLWGLFGKRLGRGLVNWLAPTAIFLAASQATLAVLRMYHLGLVDSSQPFAASENWVGAVLEQHLYTWISVADLHLDLVFRIDPLSAVMLMVVSWVSFVIHVYSIGYMAHDESYWRYFSYLNLFVFAMLLLVLGGNLAVLFIGWEGVGLCSYLLIGFWYSDTQKAQAGLKAFIANRVGDFGFLIGMFTLFSLFGSLDFSALEQAVARTTDVNALIASGVFAGWTYQAALTFGTLMLFVGATGKSAQIPLYVWLPDAMAGPTPVSALIHAATMVTAGVYMVVRLNFVFTLAPTTMMVIAVIGGLTALFAASIALVQNDIKKVLAYSTVSQLGYMFMATGVGAFAAAIFHLMAHAFFKACLFLGSGSVIHSCDGEQDMREMGGLHKKMPITAWTMGLSTLAIMGFPLFSGFFSKDDILFNAFASTRGGPLIWGLGFVAAGMTAFYMWRLMFMTFSGETRGLSEKARQHLHESPWSMTLPLIVLAFLAVVGGWVGIPPIFHGFDNYFGMWLDPIFATAAHHPANAGLFETGAWVYFNATLQHTVHGENIEWILMGASVLIGLAGLALAWLLYKGRSAAITERLPKMAGLGALYRTLLNKYWVDEAYDVFPIGFTKVAGRVSHRFIDVVVVDGLLTKVPPLLIRMTGAAVAWIQNGDVQRYMAFILFGLVFTLYFALH